MIFLNNLFEEDLNMQDSLEDMDLLDDTDDLILGAFQDRENDANKVHLFKQDEPVNADGLTEAEETEYNISLLQMADGGLSVDELI